ncbi:hypothetical protein IV203_016513 [Nitzschia inconspicua]|uniref:DUF6824 domain-containing protein n=1 Tax=Nitzschia inconspicua TaxID=303405 RepID=A0A9K3KRK6_9STRA|nr:hypothetical protein IV203_016513 [Nitzschia inconspicua]
MPAETYASTAYGAIRRIRTPHDHDVLSGRGGGINSHVGNQVFRQLVAERKEEYNLAPNKHEKARVASEVMDRVRNQDPPGRFLQRDPTAVTGPVWWVEVDEARALAKTSQALREGAPQIRLAHKAEVEEQRSKKTKRSATKRKRRTSTAPTPAVEPEQPPVPPSRPFVRRLPSDEYNLAMEKLQANVRDAKALADEKDTQQEEQDWETNSKRARLIEENTPLVSPGTGDHYGVKLLDEFSETPPLLSVPAPSSDRMESLRLGQSSHSTKDAFHHAVHAPAPTTRSLPRVHSLAFSDFSMSDTNVFDENGEFVNPFEDESNIAKKVLSSRQTSNGNSYRRLSSEYLRNLSSNEDNGISEPGLDRTWEDEQSSSHSPSIPDLITDENNNDDHIFHGSWETDFDEGMKSILDVVRPNLTAPDKDEQLPTLLFPYRGGLLTNSSSSCGNGSRRSTSISSFNRGMYDGRQ